MDNELNYQALGLKIREIRKSRNLSQEKLSELCGISPNYLSRVETNNGGIISLPTLVKVCNALCYCPAGATFEHSSSRVSSKF